ncbi:FimV/HubP family polar landmark protein [Pseudomonas sp. Marseille-QA0892]
MVQVRKLVLAIAAASSLGAGTAHALGLGEVTLQSSLNQPLVAEIELLDTRGLENNELKPSLASPEAFNQAGVDRQYFLTDLRFTPVVRPNGKSVIRVTSTKPVREPYLNFLVEVVWPNGRLMREFTLLLDPPLYSPQATAVAPQLPIAAARQPAPAPRPTAPAPAPQPQPQPQAPVAAPRAAAPAATAPGDYRVGSRDTLWQIAEQHSAGGSVHQAMLAIQDLNPDAFIDGNINRMKSGQVLRLPNEQQIRARSQSQALAEVASQNAAWRQGASVAGSGERQIDARRRDTAAPVGTQRDTEDNLRLLSGSTGQATEGAEDASGREKALADKLAVTEESLDTTRRENEELNSRLTDLQSQVDKLQRLMQLKDDQLAKLQATLAASGQAVDDPNRSPDATGAAGEAESPDGQAGATPDVAPPAMSAPDAAAPADQAPNDAAPTPSEQDQDIGGIEANPSPETAAPVAQDEQVPAEAPAAADDMDEASEGMLEGLLSDSTLMGLIGGGALLILLAALLIARRKREAQSREEPAFDAGSESELPPGSFEGLIPAEEAVSAPREVGNGPAEGTDVLGEADIYIAYGRFNQAAELLLNAIDQEPHRADLRLKLMEVYAELGDRDGFARQEAELREIGGAGEGIEQLKQRYPSLAVAALGGAAATGAAAYAANAYSEQSDNVADEQVDDGIDSLDLNEDELDFDFSDLEAELAAEVPPSRAPEQDVSLDDFTFDDEPAAPVTETVTEPVFSLEDDLSDFSLDLDADTSKPRDTVAADDEFLLDDALFDEPAETSAGAPPAAQPDEPLSSDFDLSLSDDEPFEPRTDADFAAELDRVTAELGDLNEDLDAPAAAEPASVDADDSILDDEFDFLAGTDEATTKLDLARAYIEMGDNEGAQDILDEVLAEGNDAQQQEAQDLLKKLV